MLTLYDDPISRNGYKVRLLLRHLDRPFRFVRVDITAGETRRPTFLARNVAGRVPVIEWEDGTTLAESNAILFALAEGTAYLPDDRREVLRWMFFEQNLIEPTIGTARFFRKQGRHESRPDAYAHRLETARDALGVLDRHLVDRDWVASDRCTIADIALFGYAGVAEEAGLEVIDHRNFLAWRKRLEALPRHVGWDWAGDDDGGAP